MSITLRHTFLALVLSASLAQAQDLSKQFPVKGATGQTSGKPKKKSKSDAQKKAATKGAFPTIKASQLKAAVPATNLTAAGKLIGKNGTIIGTVAKVFLSGSGKIALLNMDPDYKKAVVGSIKAADFSKFPDLTLLKGKKVALMGKIISYKGAPEVELSQAGAIKIVN